MQRVVRGLAGGAGGVLVRDRAHAERVVTEITEASTFYPAEDYHQDYFENNPFQPYCQGAVAPKVAKVRKVFKDLLKE